MGALSLASLFSLWPSVVAFLPESSASTGGVEVPRGGPPSSGALFSMSGPEPVFRFRPPPSLQLPTSDDIKEIHYFFELGVGKHVQSKEIEKQEILDVTAVRLFYFEA